MSATMHVMLSGAPPSRASASRSLAAWSGSATVSRTRDPTMAYGVGTVEAIARVVNRDLNPGAVARVPLSVISPSQEIPDEPAP